MARVNATPRRLSRGKGGTARGRLGLGHLDRGLAALGTRSGDASAAGGDDGGAGGGHGLHVPAFMVMTPHALGLKTASKGMHHRRERAQEPRKPLRFEEEPCSWTVHTAARDSIERELIYPPSAT